MTTQRSYRDPLVAIVLVAGACGRLWFDVQPADSGTTATDGTTADDAGGDVDAGTIPVEAVCPAWSGSWSISPPQPVVELSLPNEDEIESWLTPHS